VFGVVAFSRDSKRTVNTMAAAIVAAAMAASTGVPGINPGIGVISRR